MLESHRVPCHVPFAIILLVACSQASAQCTNTWLPGDGIPGIFGAGWGVRAFDPDGPGPLAERVLVYGSFQAAGNQLVKSLAIWDPVTGSWSTLGAGIGGIGLMQTSVAAATVSPSGELYIGGSFTSVNGVPSLNIARWDGSSWSAVAAGLSGAVNSLATMPNGDIVAGGAFSLSGSTSVANVARWNGTAWSALGSGLNSAVRCLLPRSNGDLLVGGFFTAAGSVPCSRIARWDGNAWSAVGGGVTAGAVVLAIDALPTGEVVIGGNFTSVGGIPTNGIARWNGSSWSALGGGLGVEVLALTVLPNGNLVAGGSFTTGSGAPASYCAKWDGSAWSALGTGGPSSTLLGLTRLANGEVIACGGFSAIGSIPTNSIARWNGAQWGVLSEGINDSIVAATTLLDGRVVVGGAFTRIGATPAARIATWDGSQWAPLGAGMNNAVNALAVLPNGDLVAGGQFTQAGGINVPGIARWNGSAWSSVGIASWPSSSTAVSALLATAVGELFAAGTTTWGYTEILRCNGTNWTPMPVTLGNGPRTALLQRDNGNLIAINQCIQEWDGSQWNLRGCLLGTAHAGVLDRNGDIVIGGEFNNVDGLPANNTARWSNGAWSTIGLGTNGGVYGLHLLPDGDLLAAGGFTTAGGNPASGVARNRGSTWTAVGAGVERSFSASFAGAGCIAKRGNELFVGGNFWIAGGSFSAGWARLTTTCPTAIASTATGCGTATVLAAETLPWLASSYRARTNGLAGSALALDVLGFAPDNLLLSTVLPQAAPGCTLTTQADVLAALLVVGDGVQTVLAIPNQSALVGQQFYQQTLSLQLTPAGALQGVGGSNRLTLTIGSW